VAPKRDKAAALPDETPGMEVTGASRARVAAKRSDMMKLLRYSSENTTG